MKLSEFGEAFLVFLGLTVMLWVLWPAPDDPAPPALSPGAGMGVGITNPPEPTPTLLADDYMVLGHTSEWSTLETHAPQIGCWIDAGPTNIAVTRSDAARDLPCAEYRTRIERLAEAGGSTMWLCWHLDHECGGLR